MRYEGNYDTFKDRVHYATLEMAQVQIEVAMSENIEDEYYTAWIFEYNIIGRQTASYFYSKGEAGNEIGWNRIDTPITDFYSWHQAKKPFKKLARWLIEISGERAKQDKKIADFVRKKRIDELNGKK
jgi:hypothetical protein